MKLRNILWTYEPHKDGACHIRIYVYYQGRKKYFPTGISVQPEFWSEKTEEVKRTHPMAKRYNAVIRTKRMEIERHFLDGGSWSGLTNKNRFGGDVIAFGRQIIAEAEAGQLPLKESTLKSYRATVKRLAAFANGAIPFESIDMDFYSQFTDYLGKNGCGLPGIGKHIKTLKRIMNLGMERNIHDNRAHKESAFRVHRTGKRAKVYLTEDEITQLEELDLRHDPVYERERDRWLVAYHLLMRFSDVSAISRQHFTTINGRRFCRYRSKKTSIEVVVPVKARAMELLDQYDYDLSFTANQVANRHIKTICAMAGINDHVDEGDRQGPKSRFVTTHTARRSAATNLYLNKASFELIAKLGGWESGVSVRLYLQATGMDSALLASDMEFFE